MKNKLPFWTLGLIFLLLSVQSCGGVENSPTAISQETPLYDGEGTVFQATSGAAESLYLTKDVLLKASLPIQVVGSINCNNLLDMLAGGEWMRESAAQIPGLAGIVNYAWFNHDDEKYFVVATGNGPGLLELLGAEPDNMGSIPTIKNPGSNLPEAEYCSATFQKISSQPISASGAFQVEGLARVIPRMCVASVDGAAVELLIEAESGLRAILNFRIPTATGEHNLNPASEDSFALQVWDSLETFQDYYRRISDSLARQLPGGMTDNNSELDTEPASDEVLPDINFQGKILVESLEPFTGKADFNGLVTLSGTPLDVSVGFTCDLLGLRNQAAQSVDKMSDGAIVQIELNYDQFLDLTGYQYTNKGFVTLSGELKPTGGYKYEGTFIAEGQGSFSDYDVDYNPCEASWSGTQQLSVTGMVYGTSMELTFTPLGAAALDDELKCWPATAPVENLPHMMNILYGERTLTIGWPPDSPNAADQTIH